MIEKVKMDDIREYIEIMTSNKKYEGYLMMEGEKEYNKLVNKDGMINYKEREKYVENYIKKNKNNERMYSHFMKICFNTISLYKGITIEMIKENKDNEWDWGALSAHKNMTSEIIKNNIEMPWEYEGILSNKNIKFEEIKRSIMEDEETEWIKEIKEKSMKGKSYSLRTIRYNNGITEEDIKSNPEMNWDYFKLSYNNNISLKFVFDNKNIKWDMDALYSRPITTWDDIKNGEYFFEEYDKENLLNNFSEETIEQISMNGNITWEIISKNLHERWNWDYVSINPNITMEIISKNIDKRWNNRMLYMNPSISIEEIKDKKIKITREEELRKKLGFMLTIYD